MQTTKKIVALVLALSMLCGMVTFASAASITFEDTSSHWAQSYISYLVDKDVLNGYQEWGKYYFKPDNVVKRSEFIKMLDETFGLQATTAVAYSDVADHWSKVYFEKAAAQGYILNYGSTANPEGQISREEAISLLVRYLDLNPANVKETTYFADYYSISDNYKAYVLQAAYANLINGYVEGGVTYFKPQNTLTRAEALTILYRAAGCIFDRNASSRDSGAADQNNVITDAGVVVSNTTLKGRNIVTEGVGTGTVYLTGCTVGSLTVRGNASITVESTNIDELIIEGAGTVSMLSGSRIKSLVMNGANAVINAYSNNTIDNLTVNMDADNVQVTGSGAITSMKIVGKNFKSSVVPTEYDIATNVTAQIGSQTVSGSSNQNSVFGEITPFMTVKDDYYYLNVTADLAGTLNYYFTDISNAPTADEFDYYFASAKYADSKSVSKGTTEEISTYSSDKVKRYEYVALMLKVGSTKYAPVVIANKIAEGNGFSTNPYLYDDVTVKFKTAKAGSVYWYYADNGTELTQAKFLKGYNAQTSALRGKQSVDSGSNYSCELKEKYINEYGYIAFMLEDKDGILYAPVVVSAGENGFTTEPYVSTLGTVTFKSTYTGKLYYYYSKTDELPTADRFSKEYDGAMKGSWVSVSAGRTDSFNYDKSYSSRYPFLIICLYKTETKTYMQPIALSIDYSTGFSEEPEFYNDELFFKTDNDGYVYWYYASGSSIPTSTDFMKNYNNASSSKYGKISVTGGKYSSIDVNYYTNTPYIVLMFTDDKKDDYIPVVLSASSSSTANTGFATNPYLSSADTIYLKTSSEDGKIFYYYTDDVSDVSKSTFYYEYAAATYYDNKSVTKNQAYSLSVSKEALYKNKTYMVFAFIESSDAEAKDYKTKFYNPVIVDLEGSGGYSSDETGLKVASVSGMYRCFVEATQKGTLYWYKTNGTKKIPSSTTEFKKYYDEMSSSESGSESMDKGEEKTINVEYGTSSYYDYLVLCLKDSNGDFLKPVVYEVAKGKSNTDSSAGVKWDNHTASGTKLTNVSVKDDGEVKFTAEVSGKVYIRMYTEAQGVSNIGESYVGISKGESDSIKVIDVIYENLTSTNPIIKEASKDTKVFLQLENGDTVYEAYEITLN